MKACFSNKSSTSMYSYSYFLLYDLHQKCFVYKKQSNQMATIINYLKTVASYYHITIEYKKNLKLSYKRMREIMYSRKNQLHNPSTTNKEGNSVNALLTFL